MNQVRVDGVLYVNVDRESLQALGLPETQVEQVVLAFARSEALSQRDTRLQAASSRMAPFQDAVDLGDATEAEAALLLEWKRYRVALSRIEEQPGFPLDIEWPSMPADNK